MSSKNKASIAIDQIVLEHVKAIIGKDVSLSDLKYNPDKKKLTFSIGNETLKISHKKFSDEEILSKTQKWIKELEKSLKLKQTDNLSLSASNNEVEKWIITLKNNQMLDRKILEKSVNSSYKELPGSIFNGAFVDATEKQIKEIRKTHREQILSIEKDIKMNIAVIKDSQRIIGTKATNSVQTIGNFIYRIGSTKSSRKNGSGTPLEQLSSTTYAFVIDTGIDGTNSELNVDSSISRNFVNGANDENWNDLNGHGTHVSGIIAAKDNTSGIVGVSPNALLVAIRVLDANGSGYVSDIIRALNYIADWKVTNPTNNAVVNMSLGGGISSSLDSAVRSLISKNVTVVVAAGNENQDVRNVSPARVLEAITIGAYNSTNNFMASWSNYGSGVDLLSPGVSIDSTLPNGQYGVFSGTSMATPVVTGAIVSMLMTNPNIALPKNIHTKIRNDASLAMPINYDGTAGSNLGITLTKKAKSTNTTNRSVYAGSY